MIGHVMYGANSVPYGKICSQLVLHSCILCCVKKKYCVKKIPFIMMKKTVGLWKKKKVFWT